VLGLPDEFDRTEPVVALSRIWVASDPKAAADFTAQLPPGELRKDALAMAVSSWARTDAGAACTWLDQFAPSSDLDYAIYEIIRLPAAQTEPQIALKWAENIVNDDQRQQGIETIVRTWVEKDQPAALRYVQDSTALNSDQRAAVMKDLGFQN
jgi:hypothetical protein